MTDEHSKSQTAGDGQPRLDYEVHDEPAKGMARVRLKGRIDVFNYLQLSGALGEVAGDRQGLSLVLDLSEVAFIASSGWSVLLGVRSRLKRNQSRLVLVGMPPHLERIYQAMKLPVLIPAYASLAEAEAALAKS